MAMACGEAASLWTVTCPAMSGNRFATDHDAFHVVRNEDRLDAGGDVARLPHSSEDDDAIVLDLFGRTDCGSHELKDLLILRFHAGRLDHLAPVIVFIVNEGLELVRALESRDAALLLYLALEFIAFDDFADFGSQALDHLGWRLGRGHDAEPGGDFIAWHPGLRRSRDFVIHRVTLVARVGESLKLAAADMCNERRWRRVDEFDAPAEHVGNRRRRTLIGYMGHLDPGHLREQLRSQML